MSHTPNTPVPSEEQYRQQLAVLDANLASLPPSETLTAIRDIIHERYRITLRTFDPQGAIDRGVDDLRFLASTFISDGIASTRRNRICAIAILLASLEVDAYEGRA